MSIISFQAIRAAIRYFPAYTTRFGVYPLVIALAVFTSEVVVFVRGEHVSEAGFSLHLDDQDLLVRAKDIAMLFVEGAHQLVFKEIKIVSGEICLGVEFDFFGEAFLQSSFPGSFSAIREFKFLINQVLYQNLRDILMLKIPIFVRLLIAP